MGLRIRLLGGVQLTHHGAVLRVESDRVESPLAYLLLHQDAPQSRQLRHARSDAAEGELAYGPVVAWRGPVMSAAACAGSIANG